MKITYSILPWIKEHDKQNQALVEKNLGPGRFSRPAYALRSLCNAVPVFAFTAFAHHENANSEIISCNNKTEAVGCVQAWDISAIYFYATAKNIKMNDISVESEQSLALKNEKIIFLGPLVVSSSWQKKGIGKLLINSVIDHAASEHYQKVLLMGDASYYTKFGFKLVNINSFSALEPFNKSRLFIYDLAS